jgi:DNA-binding MarR family transcriptional regulator
MKKSGQQPAGHPDPRPADFVISSLLRAARAVEARLDEALSKADLSGPKYGALTQLVQADGPLTLGELAARLTCVRSNITQLVDRLEADGFVHRVEDPRDRRSVRAAITALGRERQAVGARLVQEVKDELAGTLSDVDFEALDRALSLLKGTPS